MLPPVILLLVVTLVTGTDFSATKKKRHVNHEEDLQNHGQGSDMAMISSANTDFAFQLYKEIANQTTSNIFFSPMSISTALALLSLGTRSVTREQLFKGLHLDSMTEERIAEMHRDYKQLLHTLMAEQNELQLLMGNSLHIQKGYDVLPSFLNESKKFYNAEVFSLDFNLDPENARLQLNDYVKKMTKGKIKNMFDTIDRSTKLMLINYIFFKGKWEKPFDPAQTREALFKVNKTTDVTVQMMRQTNRFSMISDYNLFSSVIKLPYLGNASMIAILPADGKLEYVEQNLSHEKFDEWVQQLAHHKQQCVLRFPKVSLSLSYGLKNILAKMGVRDLFTFAANLSGISESENLKVSQVSHKAVLDIDEKSTEAAGATGVGIIPMSLPPTLAFNRPFILIIYEENTNNILFVGRLKDPSK
ncbi:alpha-1-antiproteinase-like [Hemiscyllium ocellatum]|uniref:alpha-1-antiproteinase-like n=1 Tax=Hemiscyllium ocellatum TaxID=170820 RepID=UPI002965EE3E|nr:alpha-1-antiproteinase-like [Hemiscyllium ocellatum]